MNAGDLPRLTRRSSALAIAGGWLLFFAAQLFSSEVPYYRDHLVTNVPLRQFTRDRLLSGALPQWYPFEALGVPIIGQITPGTFHPFTYLFLPLPGDLAEKATLLCAYLLGLVGAYRLGRVAGGSRLASVVGAFAYGFGGYTLGVSSIINFALSQAALPWLFWSALKVTQRQRLKDAAVMGLAGALVFLAGDAVGFLLCGVMSAGLAFVAFPSRKGAALLALAGVCAALLVGVELLPATAVAAEAARNVGQPSPTLGLTWALHPWRLLELLTPGFVPDAVRFRVTGELLGGGTAMFATTLFAGGVTLVFAGLGATGRGRLARGLAVAAGLAVLVAMGDRAGLLPKLKLVAPIFTKFRYPERYMAFFWLALAGLVPLGVDRVLSAPRRAQRVFWAAAGLTASLAALAALGVLSAAAWKTVGRTLSDPELEAQVVRAWSTGLAWSAALLALTASVLRSAEQRRLFVYLLPVLVFAELWHGNGNQLPMIDRELLLEAPRFAAAVQRSELPPARVAAETAPFFESTVTGPGKERWVAGVKALFVSDTAGLFGVNGLGANLGATSARHVMLLGARDERLGSLAGVLNACFRVARQGRVLSPDERLLDADDELGLVLIGAPCRPRAFLARTRVAQSANEAVQLTAALPRDGSEVAWEGGPALSSDAGSVTWQTYLPEHLALEVNVPSPTALVITDEFAPGWEATLDGAPVAIHPTLVTARGIEIPAGQHRVELVYRTPRLALGFGSTALGLLVVLGLCLWRPAR